MRKVFMQQHHHMPPGSHHHQRQQLLQNSVDVNHGTCDDDEKVSNMNCDNINVVKGSRNYEKMKSAYSWVNRTLFGCTDGVGRDKGVDADPRIDTAVDGKRVVTSDDEDDSSRDDVIVADDDERVEKAREKLLMGAVGAVHGAMGAAMAAFPGHSGMFYPGAGGYPVLGPIPPHLLQAHHHHHAAYRPGDVDPQRHHRRLDIDDDPKSHTGCSTTNKAPFIAHQPAVNINNNHPNPAFPAFPPHQPPFSHYPFSSFPPSSSGKPNESPSNKPMSSSEAMPHPIRMTSFDNHARLASSSVTSVMTSAAAASTSSTAVATRPTSNDAILCEQPVSRTYQYRKVMKPLLERKRRARINRCLDELKELMVGALHAEGENVSKLEKADVLELTVTHLRKLRRLGASAASPFSSSSSSSSASSAEDVERFRAGFTRCAAEVSNFLARHCCPQVSVEKREETGMPDVARPPSNLSTALNGRLLCHLGQCIRSIQTLATSAIYNSSNPSPAGVMPDDDSGSQPPNPVHFPSPLVGYEFHSQSTYPVPTGAAWGPPSWPPPVPLLARNPSQLQSGTESDKELSAGCDEPLCLTSKGEGSHQKSTWRPW